MCGLNLAYERNTDILYSSQKLAVVSCSRHIIPYTNVEVYHSIGLMLIKDMCHEYLRRRSVLCSIGEMKYSGLNTFGRTKTF